MPSSAPPRPAASPAPPSSPGRFRWSICGLLFFSAALNYIDRNIIGILKQPLSRDLGWSETDYAHIASAFQFAYAFGYLFGGRLMDRFGMKRGLPVAVLLWSLAAAAHGFCSLLPHDKTLTLSLAWISLGALVLPATVFGFKTARVALGLAEGGNFPGAIKTVAEWFPAKERALATGLFNAGTNVGAILCPFAVPRLYAAWGWPVTFYATGALGVLWLAAWRWLYDSPDAHPRLTAAERTYIRAAGQPVEQEKKPSVPWLSLFSYRATWAYIAASVLADEAARRDATTPPRGPSPPRIAATPLPPATSRLHLVPVTRLHLFSMALLTTVVPATAAPAWISDLGNGQYRNPLLHADYSDPDAIRVGQDYWLTSSSFSHVPGLPILHSRDLVNWELVAHALPRLVPEEAFATPQAGKGVWAPSLRHHAGRFWIYYPDPDFGLYVITATDPRGPWSAPVLVRGGRGLIDPCPLWDDDGSVYLIHGWAKSRAGIANVLTLLKLTPDGRSVAEDLGIVIDGNKLPDYRTLEGPKLYKRDGWYYVFAPAGGVKTGWQSVFRSRSIRGPYEDRIVLAQGNTPVNGPHQGALVDTPDGRSWFLHFQDREAYGRIVHLQPVVWRDGWPVIGADPDGDGRGEPVLQFEKPVRLDLPPTAPPTSDEFNTSALGLQWQWQANPSPAWHSLAARPGFLRLFAQPVGRENLFHAPHLLLQKFPAPQFTVTTRLEFHPGAPADAAGLIVFGYDYAWIGLRDRRLVHSVVRHAQEQPAVTETAIDVPAGPLLLRVTVDGDARCRFAWSQDGDTFTPVGAAFQASVSRWVGAKVGVFASGEPAGFADFDWFRVDGR